MKIKRVNDDNVSKEIITSPRYCWNADMVRAYFHHSELERRWAFSLIGKVSFDGNEEILDVGCRDGKITADISRFVPNGKVHGEDPSEEMISWAKKQFHFAEYPNISFSLGSTFKIASKDQYDIIFSFCAMQFSKDPVQALIELKSHLKPGGKIFLTFPAPGNTDWQLANREMRESPKWIEYWEDFEPSHWRTSEEWNAFLNAAGFSSVRIEKIKTMDPFVDKVEWVEWLKAVYPPLIPKQMQNNFFNELIDRYLSHDPSAIDDKGVIYAKFGRIEIESEYSDG